MKVQAVPSADVEGITRSLIEAIGEGCLALDNDGRVVYANPSAEHFLGRTAAQLAGLTLDKVFLDWSAGSAIGDWLPSMQAQNGSERIVCLDVDGRSRQFEVKVHPSATGSAVLFHDVTDWLHHELEVAKLNSAMAAGQELLRRKNEELNAMLEQIAQADRVKSEFLANTSHELRTPLNSILGFLQLIDEDMCESHDEEREYVRGCIQSANDLLGLINNVLDIAKIEGGMMQLLITDVDIEDVLQNIYEKLEVHARAKNLPLEIDIEGLDPMIVRADREKLQDVLINLVGNAIKFTHQGQVSIVAEPDPRLTDYARISVKDTGIGIEKAQQNAIFEKFFQADGASTRKYEGTGLGLALTKNLVHLMGGEIFVQSDGIGHGTTMSFTIPLSQGASVDQASCDDGLAGEDSLPTTF